MCRCGFPAQLRTSWSTDNSGRSFFDCRNYDSLVMVWVRWLEFCDVLVLEFCDVNLMCYGMGMKTNCDEDVVAETSDDDDDVTQTASDDDVMGMLSVALLTCRIYSI
ncbi:hypothetical protein V6N11_018024 [Hibiscus sabdariffa]|uniref:Zinc finger GRF-type domain-containing protein n=1 Tax=Hibiscus sabdariffa TaxID=183260 RepID=A0ABR2T660_9ROSI